MNKKPQPTREWAFDADQHGASSWADAAHLETRGYGPDGSHLLGWLPSETLGTPNIPITYSGARHQLILAPTRGGKAVSGCVPRLLDHAGSSVVLDVKNGELALITARYRQDVLGQNVILIDPYDEVASRLGFEPSSLNALREIDINSDEAFDDSIMLAEATTIGEKGGDRYWTDEATTLIAGLALHNAQLGHSLKQLRSDLNRDQDGFEQLIREMKSSPYSLIRSAGARISSKAERERSSVISTAQRNTHFLESKKLAGALSRSDFDLSHIGENTTIYIVLPVDRLYSARGWLRTIIALLISGISKLPTKPRQPVMFLLEEMAALDRLGIVERSYGLLAGLGLQMVGVVQDLAQLRGIYGERWQTFAANSACIQCFGTNDEFTARYLSGLSGQSTSERLSFESAEIRASLFGDPEYRSAADGLQQRPLITPSELMSLHPTTQFIKLAAAHPVLAYRPAYFIDALYRDRRGQPLYDIHPHHADRKTPQAIDFARAGNRLGGVLEEYLTVG